MSQENTCWDSGNPLKIDEYETVNSVCFWVSGGDTFLIFLNYLLKKLNVL